MVLVKHLLLSPKGLKRYQYESECELQLFTMWGPQLMLLSIVTPNTVCSLASVIF